jgi:hypothetical protein
MECPICLEPINTGSFIKFIPCDHHIHIECINNWKKCRNNNSLIYKCISCDTYRDYDFTINPVREILNETHLLPNEEVQVNVRRNIGDIIVACFRRIFRI